MITTNKILQDLNERHEIRLNEIRDEMYNQAVEIFNSRYNPEGWNEEDRNEMIEKIYDEEVSEDHFNDDVLLQLEREIEEIEEKEII